MRFEDLEIMDWVINNEEEEILNAGLTPCSHTTTTEDKDILSFLKRVCSLIVVICFLCFNTKYFLMLFM